jgi:protein required for attachment to host cells
MNTVWILVCDAARSRLFESSDRTRSWILLETMAHGASRSKTSSLASDQSGSRSSEGLSVHHNALAPASSPKEVEKWHFAHSLVKMLDQAMRAKRFWRWVLVAPPRFVGLIANELTPELKKSLLKTLDKDLTLLDMGALAKRLEYATRIPLNEREAVRAYGKHPH